LFVAVAAADAVAAPPVEGLGVAFWPQAVTRSTPTRVGTRTRIGARQLIIGFSFAFPSAEYELVLRPVGIPHLRDLGQAVKPTYRSE
jgi:hypothetical protein